MKPSVVCNAGPLIALGGIGRLETLSAVYADVLVPEPVMREVLVGGGTAPGADAIRAADWLRTVALKRATEPALLAELDHGEASVIELARQENVVTVLLDEAKARRVARQMYGLRVVGTGRTLVAAKRLGLIERVGPLLTRIRGNGYWLSDKIVETILAHAGETL